MGLKFLSILCLIVASSVKGEGGCRDLQFLDCQQDKALTGHVIKIIRMLTPALEQCQHECFKDDRCVSYNLGPVFGAIRSCELSDTDHVEYPDDVKSLPGSEYCPLKNPCASNPCLKDQICRPDFKLNTFRCGDNRSCAGLKRLGLDNNGVYNITPVPNFNIQVYCDQETNGGGWTVIQKRLDGSVDFYREWDDYKRGFGNKNGEYWLGLDAIHILTNNEKNEIRIELQDFDLKRKHAQYDSFVVDSEKSNYALHLGLFVEGEAGDSFSAHNGMKFSTIDQDNDNFAISCAKTHGGGAGWWFDGCFKANLNGQYLKGQSDKTNGIAWSSWHGTRYSNKEAEMKLRPANLKY